MMNILKVRKISYEENALCTIMLLALLIAMFTVRVSAEEISFLEAQRYPVGMQPTYVEVADLNGDEAPDLITANTSSDNVSVLLGNGNGTFQSQQTFSVGSAPRTVTVGDLDGDSILDLVVPNRFSSDVSILLGNGDGTFQTQQRYYAGYQAWYVSLGDFDGDEILDMAVAVHGANLVSVRLGNGNGTFKDPPETYEAGGSPMCVLTEDLNNDGILDMIVDNYWGNNISIRLGIGDGKFGDQFASYSIGQRSHSVAVSDLNGDDKLDLVAGNVLDNDVSILMGNGNGTFQAQQRLSIGTYPYWVELADLNANSFQDIVTVDVFNHGVAIRLGNGDGTFQEQLYFDCSDIDPTPTPTGVAVSDLDKNGTLDLITSNQNTNDVSVLLQNFPPSYFAIVGYSSVSTKPGVKIFPGSGQARVGSNGTLYLHQDNKVGTETDNGYMQSLGNMRIGPRSEIFGDIVHNGTLTLDFEGTSFEPIIHGIIIPGGALEIDEPNCEVTAPGGPDLNLGWRATHTFTDGDNYNNFSVGPRSTLVFPSGVYSFQSLDVGQDTTIYLQAPVEIHVADLLEFNHRVHHILTAGSAEQVLWLLGDDASFTTKPGRRGQTELLGTYCGLNASASIGQDYILTGAVYADTVAISWRTVINSSPNSIISE